jgi:hypothetical protein
MTWIFELLIIFSVFGVIYWILYGEKKQKELLSQSEKNDEDENN